MSNTSKLADEVSKVEKSKIINWCGNCMEFKSGIVNSQYIAIQLYRGTLVFQFDTPSTRTTAFETTLSLAVSLKSLKCNISITNCPIAIQFDTGVKSIRRYMHKIITD